MKKLGMVYRYLAETVLSNRKSKFVVRGAAAELGVSPNTVSLAIAPLKRSGAVAMYRAHFEVINLDKLLALWAVGRRLDRDVVYRTYVEFSNVQELEKHMPDGVAYTSCSGYCAIFKNDVSDYGNVYVYATASALEEIKKRFPERKLSRTVEGYNLFILKPDSVLEKMITERKLKGASVSLPQLYVDLWDSKEWYSYEFLKKVKKKIDDAYANAILE